MADDILVLLRYAERRDSSPEDVVVMGVYPVLSDIEARISRIAKTNPQYPMIRISASHWRLGPDEDEGFFGNKVIHFFIRSCGRDSVHLDS